MPTESAGSGARLLDGRAPARRIREAVRSEVEDIRRQTGKAVSLATLLVGSDPASKTYVRMKQRRCGEAGIESISVELPPASTTEDVVAEVRKLCADPGIHAVLVQHPVPRPIDRRAVFEAISIEKDIDCVSAAALGRAILGMEGPAPCTPLGIMRLLEAYEVPVDGAHAVVIGRSPILGRPMASMLINAHATVTLCHSRTGDVAQIVGQADLLIAAVGRPRFVAGDWIRPGSVVIDAGYNEGNVGDVDFEGARARASLITPVPGGVGPMTIAMLLRQTVDAARRHLGLG